MSVISGRTDGDSEDSNTSSHVRISSSHNASENPAVGLSGRIPLKTFCMTAVSRLMCSKGIWPVATCRGKLTLGDRNKRGCEPIRSSRTVIPRAYMSVPFDGSFPSAFLTYPYLSGSRISGAIQRIVPPAFCAGGPSTEFASSTIAARPKSARQARRSELIRIFA